MQRLALALLLALLASPAAAAEYPARVVGVSDGDTLTVLRDGRTQVKIRLHGIDAPETGQPFGSRAKQALSELAFGQTVTVRERGVDRYGRKLSDVVLRDGRSLNRELVRGGWAWHYRQYAPKDVELARLESDARAAKRGLWASPGALPPWDYRKGGGEPVAPPGSVVGNRNSHVYHAPTCTAVRRMKPENRVTFGTAAEAQRAGYRKAGDCRLTPR